MKYVEIEVTEILQKKVMIAIDDNCNHEEAITEAQKMYFEDKLKLGIKDFVDVSFGLS